jgi:signal transduction histidine kinase
MREGTARRTAHGLWSATVALWLVALVLVVVDSPSGASDVVLVLIAGIPTAVYASVGALVARTSPRNPIGWILGGVGLATTLWAFGSAYAQVGFEDATQIGGLPGATLAAWIATVSVIAILPIALPLFLLHFPDGHLRSRRWRPVLWATVVAGALMLLGVFGSVWDFDPVVLRPPSWAVGLSILNDLYVAGVTLVFATSFAGLFSLILRYRAATPEQRQPLRLLVWMLVAMAISTALAIAVGFASGGADWAWFAILLAVLVDGFGILLGIPIAAAAAVLTFGLYGVGVVVKKTVVYVVLLIFFLLLLGFIALVFNPLLFIGASEGSSGEATTSRIVAVVAVVVALLAVGFRPAKRLARRVVYGRRATPYEAMSEFSERLGEAYSTDDVLPRMAAIVRASTGAAVARVWLHVGHQLRPLAADPPEAEDVSAVDVLEGAAPVIDGLQVFPVRDRGELLGALTVEMPAAEPLSRTGEQLVNDLASQAGLVLRNVRLVEELQESRRRIVAAQDERARKLERDLHDGAQQQLVALSVKQRLAASFVGKDDGRARVMLDELQLETNDALENLRDLARGIYPPLLADRGLAAALEGQARKSAIPVEVRTQGIGRYDQEIESAVYFSILEAMQNVSKYAEAGRATVTLSRSNGLLSFEIVDDGRGFDTTNVVRGTGLRGMADRIEAVGGRLAIESSPGSGTRISGVIEAAEAASS